NMTRFLMNLDEAVDLVQFAFEHANPGDLFIQKAPASTIGDLAEAVQEVFGRVGTQVIGTRHGEKLFETLMTREERLRAEDMGGYYRVACDSRDLNYDKFVVDGEVETQADESYTSHNTERLTWPAPSQDQDRRVRAAGPGGPRARGGAVGCAYS
ncbi:MAG: polysaccharide biosynthesis protein, partial [Collinsella sp.]